LINQGRTAMAALPSLLLSSTLTADPVPALREDYSGQGKVDHAVV
jgi:hypothetical protein